MTNNSADSLFPDVAAGGGYVHVAYEDYWPGNIEIMYKRIAGNGGGAVDQTRRLTFSAGYSMYPAIAVSKDGQIANIIYSEQPVEGGSYLYYKRITGSGAGSYSTRRLTFGADPATNSATSLDIAVSTGSDDQYVYIVYETIWPGNKEIMYKRLDSYGQSGGSTFTARLTYSSTGSYGPTIAFDGVNNIVQVAYYDYWNGLGDVFHRKLTSYGGAGFSGQRVSWGIGESSYPAIAATSAGAYIVWMDDTSGNFEILVKKGS